jgi:hypothetical protein
LYHAVTKEDIRTAYRSANYEGDSLSVNVLFGLEDKEFTHKIPVQDLHNFVETGDVLVFHSNKGSELGHVALVLDSFEKLWVASHWSLPKEKMIKITPNRIFTLSRDSVIERFNKEIQEASDRIIQYQANISSMLEIESLSPERITDLKKDYIVDHSCEDVSELMQYVKEKRESEYKEFSEFEIQPYEKHAINQLYLQVRQLIESFESAIKKYREKQDVLGVVYDYIDSFEQISPFYSPLYDLEYLENDTITVSTKFRSFFQD